MNRSPAINWSHLEKVTDASSLEQSLKKTSLLLVDASEVYMDLIKNNTAESR